MKAMRWSTVPVLLAVLVSPRVALEQNQVAQANLGVNGRPGQAMVIQVDGRSYVDLEALARLANGSLDFSGAQIMLWLPGAAHGTPPSARAPKTDKLDQSQLSKEFLRAGIEETTSLREWRSVLQAVVQNSYPISADWMANYSSNAQRNLRMMELAATTDADRSTLQLVRNLTSKMQQLSDKIIATRKNVEYIDPALLDNDALNQQIMACGHSLTAMAAAGTFQDDGSCH
jgi:hypothetical protein